MAPDWPWKPGRDIYQERSLTGLNKVPVRSHEAYVLGGLQMATESMPLPIKRLTEGLIVDGTIVIEKIHAPGGDIVESKFLTGILEARPEFVLQKLPGLSKNGRVVHREFVLENTTWTVTDYEDYERAKATGESPERVAQTEIPKDDLYVYPNGIGIIAEAQDTFKRLEEIERKVRRTTNKAVQIIIAGHVGDVEQAKEAVSDEDSDTVLFPDDVEVKLVASTALVDQFHSDFNTLMPLYNIMTNMVAYEDSANESGYARRLRMAPMLYYIKDLRGIIVEIMKDHGTTVEFDRIVVTTVDERLSEVNFLREIHNDGAIDRDELLDRERKLLV
jgi:hypothetical protein